jgi:hypothetical protein
MASWWILGTRDRKFGTQFSRLRRAFPFKTLKTLVLGQSPRSGENLWVLQIINLGTTNINSHDVEFEIGPHHRSPRQPFPSAKKSSSTSTEPHGRPTNGLVPTRCSVPRRKLSGLPTVSPVPDEIPPTQHVRSSTRPVRSPDSACLIPQLIERAKSGARTG